MRLELDANGRGTLLVGDQQLAPPSDPESGEVREVDCLMLYLCSIDPILGCRCTESSCRVSNSGAPIHARFDLTLSDDGASLIGSHQLDTITGDLSSLGDVTFTREAK